MFLLLNKTLTILCDTSAIFMKEHSLAIHIIESVISWCIPAVLVIVVFWSGGKTYGLQSTDPLACGPVDLEVAYYTLSLPMQIVFGIALTAVILFHAVKDCKVSDMVTCLNHREKTVNALLNVMHISVQEVEISGVDYATLLGSIIC